MIVLEYFDSSYIRSMSICLMYTWFVVEKVGYSYEYPGIDVVSPLLGMTIMYVMNSWLLWKPEIKWYELLSRLQLTSSEHWSFNIYICNNVIYLGLLTEVYASWFWLLARMTLYTFLSELIYILYYLCLHLLANWI